MKVAIGSDHRGVDVKSRIVNILETLGHTADDLGTHTTDSCDYPDIAHAVARRVSTGRADRGVLICGSRIGMSMTANKTPEIRAALCTDHYAAEMSRRHNDANVLCLSADRIEAETDSEFLPALVDIWMKTEFEGGRHQRRVEKISQPSTASSCNE